jgi:DNA-binding HxlR family transcriptional regulator
MRRTRFDEWPCPIARTTDLIGDWWTPLIMREAFYGCRRFDQFQERLQVNRATLTARLGRLVDEGMLTKEAYEERPARYEYVLTDKGRDFWAVLAAMWRFGEDWLFPDGDLRVRPVDRTTGDPVRYQVVVEATGQPVDVRRTSLEYRGRSGRWHRLERPAPRPTE